MSAAWNGLNIVESIATAIARQEGYYVEDKKTGKLVINPKKVTPVTANNPGCLIIPPSKTVTKFPSITAGWIALQNQVKANIFGGTIYPRRLYHPMNLYEFFAGQRDAKGNLFPGGYPGYAPLGHGKNDPKAYAENISAWTGIDPKVKLITLVK